jgi:hypothetical protein
MFGAHLSRITLEASLKPGQRVDLKSDKYSVMAEGARKPRTAVSME